MFPAVVVPLLIFLAVIARTIAALRSDPRRSSNALWVMGSLIVTGMMVSVVSNGSDPITGVMIGIVFFSPILVLALIVALVANGLVTWRLEGRSLANLLSLLAGIGLAAAVVFFFISVIFSQQAPWLPVLAVLIVFICAWAGFLIIANLVYAWLYPHLWRRPSPDFVVVHGSGLVRGHVARLLGARIDEGIARWRAGGGKSIPLILSGGKGPDEPRSEAEAMAEYAMNRGVPPSAILLEDRSRTTEENLEFTRDLVREHLGEGAQGVAVTSDYHVLRTASLAREVGLDVQVAPAPSAFYFRVNAFLREFVAILARRPIVNGLAAAAFCLPFPALIMVSMLLA